jgi:DinB superfamily
MPGSEERRVAKTTLVGLVFGAWDDVDRVLQRLDTSGAVRQVDGGSSFAWTLGHLSNQLDTWLNVRFFGETPNALLAEERFRTGGTGQAEDWLAIQEATRAVRATARGHLETLAEPDLHQTRPYQGRMPHLQGTSITLGYALARVAAHHYFHLGEIATVRSRRLGEQVGDYPGLMRECA